MRMFIKVKAFEDGKVLYSTAWYGQRIGNLPPLTYWLSVTFVNCEPPTRNCYISVDEEHWLRNCFRNRAGMICPNMAIFEYKFIRYDKNEEGDETLPTPEEAQAEIAKMAEPPKKKTKKEKENEVVGEDESDLPF